MSFTAHSKFTNDINEKNIESENSGNVENKNQPLDIYDSDIEINNEIEQVNNVRPIHENNEQQNEDIVAQKLNQQNNASIINLPKANDNIEYLNPDSNHLEKALILEQQEKPPDKISFDLISKILKLVIYQAQILVK